MTGKELERCMHNQYWRMNNLYHIVNEDSEKVLFQMRPAQEMFYFNRWYFNIILKARQHGFTTLIDLLGLDTALFTSNYSTVIIAHKKEDAELIFWNKIMTAYDSLPAAIRNVIRPIKRDAGELRLSNGSSVRVTTSARSGTVNFLHISEYGKICAQYANKAREIKLGSLPAVHPGNFCFIESTAEGNSGHFYELCQQSEKDLLTGKKLQKKSFKFFFYPWFDNPKYRIPIDEDTEKIPDKLKEYFEELEAKHGIELEEEEKNWYFMEWKNFGDDMFQEYPSTSEEAFRKIIEGAYYKRAFRQIYAERRICSVPYAAELPVWTFWDLGIADSMAIWFIQPEGRGFRVIDHYEAEGEGLAHYAGVLQDKGYRYGGHYAPHDINVREIGTGVSRLETAAKLGIKFEMVPTNIDVPGGIQACRELLPLCWFDEAKTAEGVKCLENYRKEWDEKHACFQNKPLHDWTSHSADAFRTFGTAYKLGRLKNMTLNTAGQAAAKGRRQTRAKSKKDVF